VHIPIKKDTTLITSIGGSFFYEKAMKSTDMMFSYGTEAPFLIEREIIKYYPNISIKTFDADLLTLNKIYNHISLFANKKKTLYIAPDDNVYNFFENVNYSIFHHFETITIKFPNFTEHTPDIISITKKLFTFSIIAYNVKKDSIELTFSNDVCLRQLDNTILNLDSSIEKFF
jgi:hypothetical protein